MEQIKIKHPKHKLVEDGFEEKIYYQTIDGIKFEDEIRAQAHEEYIKEVKEFDEKYNRKKIDIDEYNEAIFIKDKKDIIKPVFKKIYGRSFPVELLEQGWNFIEKDNSGDYTYYYVTQPHNIIVSKQEEIDRIRDFIEINREDLYGTK